MPLSTNRFIVDSTPSLVLAASDVNRVAIFSLDVGQVFIGTTNAVTVESGFPLSGRPLPTVFPIPLGTELWAVAQVQDVSPVTLFVSVADGPLTNAELRALPVQIQTARTPLVPLAPVTAVVGTVSALLVPANPNRKGLVISIVTANRFVSFGFDGYPAVLNSGITLNNVITSIWSMSESTFTTAAVNAISGNNGTVVSVQEFV